MPREFADPYKYPGTDTLKNKPGIRDADALRAFEYEQAAQRGGELVAKPIPGRLDLDHLKAIHRHLFQDVYEWAGQARNVNIGKGGSQFAQPAFIEGEGRRLSAALAREDHLHGLDKDRFVERFAEHYADWNALHPFREGNGRATRAFFSEVARQAGYGFNQAVIENDKQQWNDACAMSFHGRMGPLREVMARAVEPLRERSVGSEQASPVTNTVMRLAEQSGLRGADLARAREQIQQIGQQAKQKKPLKLVDQSYRPPSPPAPTVAPSSPKKDSPER